MRNTLRASIAREAAACSKMKPRAVSMDREHIDRTLRQMEHVRELAMEADTKREERRLMAEYGRMWRSIKPFLDKETKRT